MSTIRSRWRQVPPPGRARQRTDAEVAARGAGREERAPPPRRARGGRTPGRIAAVHRDGIRLGVEPPRPHEALRPVRRPRGGVGHPPGRRGARRPAPGRVHPRRREAGERPGRSLRRGPPHRPRLRPPTGRERRARCRAGSSWARRTTSPGTLPPPASRYRRRGRVQPRRHALRVPDGPPPLPRSDHGRRAKKRRKARPFDIAEMPGEYPERAVELVRTMLAFYRATGPRRCAWSANWCKSRSIKSAHGPLAASRDCRGPRTDSFPLTPPAYHVVASPQSGDHAMTPRLASISLLLGCCLASASRKRRGRTRRRRPRSSAR